MPQGMPRLAAWACWERTAAMRVRSSRVFGISAEPQRRHQVFEHGAGPGEEHEAAVILGVGAAQLEPAFLRDVFFGDGGEDGGAGFGGEQVVAGGLELVRLHVESDGHEQAAGIEQEGEVHLVGELSGLGGGVAQVVDQAQGVGADFGEKAEEAVGEISGIEGRSG